MIPLVVIACTDVVSGGDTPCADVGQSLTPAVVTVAVGVQAQMRFEGTGSSCTRAPYRAGESLVWAIGDTMIATVSATGEIRGRRVGTTSVRASVVRDPALTQSGAVLVR